MATTSTTLTATNSFNLTPQAQGDVYYYSEDSAGVFVLDVMANDLGGAAKTLYSLDNGLEDDGTSGSDLLIKDGARAEATSNDTSAHGAKIWITSDGKVGYDSSTLSAGFLATVQSLGVGETITDTFTYAIRLANGTLSWTTATVTYTGLNDRPVLSLDTSGGVTEDASSPNLTDTGALSFTDVDIHDTHTVSAVYNNDASWNGGSLTAAQIAAVTSGFSVDTDSWDYSVANSAVQFLGDGETITLSFNVTVADNHGGSDTKTVTLTITGTNDDPALTVDTAGSVTEDDATPNLTDTGALSFTDVDVNDTHSVSASYNADASWTGGSLTAAQIAAISSGFSADGDSWDYSVANSAVQFLDDGESVTLSFDVTVSDNHGGSDTETVTITITGQDDQPTLAAVTDGLIAEDDQLSTTTVSGLSGTLGGADADASDTLTYGIDGGAVDSGTATLEGTYGTLSLDTATGDYVYTPNADAIEALDDGDTDADVFTFTVTDGDGALVTQTYTVNVTGSDDAPTLDAVTDGSIAEDDQASTTTTSDLSGTLAGHDVDADDTLTYGIDGGTEASGTSTLEGTYGTLTLDMATGGYTYTPNADAVEALDDGQTDADVFTFTVTDGDGALVTQTYTVNVTGADDAPTLDAVTSGSVAEDDQASTTTTSDLSGTLAGHDVDAGDTLTYGIDGGTEVLGTSTLEGTYGTLTLDVATGGYTYTPNSDAIEALDDGDTDADMFTFTVTDGDGALVTQTYTVNVTGADDAPTLDAVTSGSIAEDDQASTTTTSDLSGTLAGHDVDADDTLTYGIDGGAVDAGTATLEGTYGTLSLDVATGDYLYTPNADAIEALDDGQTDADVFTFTVTDGDGALVTQTYTVNVTGADDAPTLEAVTSGSVAEDDQASTTTTSDLSGTLAGHDVDADDTLTYGIDGGTEVLGTSTLEGTYGTLTLDVATGGYTYTPNADAIEALDDGDTDADVFTFTVTDGDGALVTQTYTVNVTGADDAPTLDAVTSGSVAEDDQASTTTTSDLSGTLAGHDVDADDTLTYGIDGGAVDSGTSTLEGTYGTLTLDVATGDYVYTPNADAIEALDDGDTDADVFTFTVTDGDGALVTQTYTANVTGADDAPTLDAVISGSIAEDDQASTTTVSDLSGTLAGHDVDAGDTLTYGIDGGTELSGTSTLEGTYGTLSLDTTTGDYVFTPNADAIEALDDGDTDADVFTFTVTDGDGALVTQTYTVNVTGADDAPTLDAVTSGSVAEDDQASTTTTSNLSGTLAGHDVDADDTLTYGIDGGAEDAGTSTLEGTYGTLTLDTATGDYVYTPNADAIEALDDGATDADVFTFTVTDGDGALVTQTYTVNVTGADDAPTLDAVTSGSVAEDDQASTTTTSDLSGTLAGHDVDADDTLTYGIDGGAVDSGTSTLEETYGTLTVDTATGAYLYTPNADAIEALDQGDTDSDVFTVTVSDGDGPAVTRTFTVDISGANDAPVIDDGASDLSPQGDEDTAITGAVQASDVDADDSFTFSVVNTGTGAPANGTVSIDADTGAYSYTGDQDFNGSDSFTVTVTDSHGATDTVVVNVTVDPVNDAPVIDDANSDLSPSGAEDTAITGAILASDVDGDSLTYSAPAEGQPGGPAHGSVSFDTSGGYTYTPDANYNGSDSFTVTVSDGNGGQDTVAVSVTVDPANDAPTLSDPTDITYTDTSAADDFVGVTASLSAGDIDGDTLTYGLTGSVSDGSLSGYNVSTTSTYGKMYLNTSTGAYHFEPNDAAINGLAAGSNPTASFAFSVNDGHSGTASQTLDVHLTGANEAPTSPVSPAVYNGTDDPNDFDTGGPVGTVYSSPSSGNNNILGTNSGETINAGNGVDVIYGLGGDDTLSGDSDTDTIYGGEGNDIINGGQANDKLYGGSGNDTIHGDSQDDLIYGGYGADTLTGDANTDTFVYLSIKDTGDTITDFVHGTDKIDLTAIDANTAVLNDQAFTFVAADTNAVQANSVTWHYDSGAGVTHIWADVNGDTTADLQIDLNGNIALSSGDFIL